MPEPLDSTTLRLLAAVGVLGIVGLGLGAATEALPVGVAVAAVGGVLAVTLVLLAVHLAAYRAPTPESRRLLRRCWTLSGLGVGLALLVIPATLLWLPAGPILLAVSATIAGLAGRAIGTGDARGLGFSRRISYHTIFGMIATACVIGNIVGGFALFAASEWVRARIVAQMESMLDSRGGDTARP